MHHERNIVGSRGWNCSGAAAIQPPQRGGWKGAYEVEGYVDVLAEGGAVLQARGSAGARRGRRPIRRWPARPGRPLPASRPPALRRCRRVTACARGPTPCRRHLRARAHQPPPQLPVLNPVLRGVKQGGCERQASAGRRPLEGEAPWARWRQETPSPDV